MSDPLPRLITIASESPAGARYDNHVIGSVNDHVVRISTMTEPFYWHVHPDSDETFLCIEGGLRIEFESGVLELQPGQLGTVPRGARHRTSPLSARSVNLTFERANAETLKIEPTQHAQSGSVPPSTPQR